MVVRKSWAIDIIALYCIIYSTEHSVLKNNIDIINLQPSIGRERGYSNLAQLPPDTRPENQALETVEESSLPEQKDEPVLTELDME